jgi:outer membrane protein insertion porin family
LLANIFVQPGQGFSQQLVTASEERIEQILSQQGYAFADVQPVTSLDDETKQVDLTFFVDPQSRVYVRRIDFTGAEGSNDEVYRRELRQLEGGVLQSGLLDRSEDRIRLLPYVDDVSHETNTVVGRNDLVDVTFDVEEGLPGSMGGSIGYSDAQGVILGGDFVHSNFLGTGNRVQVNLNGGKYFTVYSFSFTQPYRSQSGISRQISLQYQDITQFSSVTSDFSTTIISAGMNWGLPISEQQRLTLGFSYNDSELLMSAYSSPQARQWVQNNGESFQITPNGSLFGTRVRSVDMLLGWELENRNRSLFPDAGMRVAANLQASVPGSDVEYYLAYLNVEKYFPLFGQWRFRINSQLSFGDAYGDSTTALPPYKNFFAGGPDSVRGYKEDYLGPRDDYGNPNGGNMLFVNQIELMLPTPEKFGANARMAFFYDFGNVFHTGGIDFYDRLGDKLDTSFSFDRLKRSYGLGVQWLSPMGLLQFSYAIPLNKDRETDRYYSDQTENFQFTIRQGF